MIVVTSDNGLAFGEHRWTMKTCAYDECLRVPFLVRMPEVAHRSEPAIVSTVDLAPTIAELAGVTPPRSLAGVSLVDPVEDGGRPTVSPARSTPSGWATRPPFPRGGRCERTRFAYVELATGERELYALREDPFQLVNVVDEPRFATVVERLSVALDAYRSE